MEEESNLSCPHPTSFHVASLYLLPILLQPAFSTLISNSLSTLVHMHGDKCDLVAHSLWRRRSTVSSCAAPKLFGIDFVPGTASSYY